MTELGKHVVIVNFKAYREVDGAAAVELAKKCQQVSEETGACIAVCPPVVSLAAVAAAVDIPVLSQNVDPRAPGSATGWVTPSMVRSCGAIGTLINHSEHKVDAEVVGECVELSLGCDLTTVVCADTVDTAVSLARFVPDFIAVEPPELIGGDISVTTVNPRIVESTVESVKDVNKAVRVLCGAGVKTGKDVAAAIDLGADGVLLASGVVKAKDQYAVLTDLVSAL